MTDKRKAAFRGRYAKLYERFLLGQSPGRVARSVGRTRPDIIGRCSLLYLWAWSAAPDGWIEGPPDVVADIVERVMEWDGRRGRLYRALVVEDVLREGSPDSGQTLATYLPGWLDAYGETLKELARDASYKRSNRVKLRESLALKAKRPTDAPTDSPTDAPADSPTDRPPARREEKRREEEDMRRAAYAAAYEPDGAPDKKRALRVVKGKGRTDGRLSQRAKSEVHMSPGGKTVRPSAPPAPSAEIEGKWAALVAVAAEHAGEPWRVRAGRRPPDLEALLAMVEEGGTFARVLAAYRRACGETGKGSLRNKTVDNFLRACHQRVEDEPEPEPPPTCRDCDKPGTYREAFDDALCDEHAASAAQREAVH